MNSVVLDHDVYIHEQCLVQIHEDVVTSRQEQLDVVVTTFRFGCVNPKSKIAIVNCSLLDLVSMRVKGSDLILVFDGDRTVCIQTEEKTRILIANSVLFASQSITCGFAISELPEVHLPAKYLVHYLPPSPDPLEAVLATYLAVCDTIKTRPNPAVIDAMITSQGGLNFSEFFYTLDKDYTKDCEALLHTLRTRQASSLFPTLVISNVRMGDALRAVGECLAVAQSEWESIEIDNTKSTNKEGAVSLLAAGIGRQLHNLRSLKFANNAFGDDAVLELIGALAPRNQPSSLECLSFQDLQMGNSSLTRLCEMLSTGFDNLVQLTVSDVPKLGKSGRAAVNSFVGLNHSLKYLALVNCDLDMKEVIESLLKNFKLPQRIQFLDFSQNKFSVASVNLLTTFVAISNSLSNIVLQGCTGGSDIRQQLFSNLIDAALQAKDKHRYCLNFNNMELGSKGVAVLEKLVKPLQVATINSLEINSCAIGAEGILTVCQMLVKNPFLSSLSVDKNFKVGRFQSSKSDLPQTIANVSTKLVQLSMRGDDSNFYLDKQLIHLFSSLRNNTSLRFLDITGNRFGDLGAAWLAVALSENRTLESVHCDRNRIGFTGFKMLFDAICGGSGSVPVSMKNDELDETFRAPPRDKRNFTDVCSSSTYKWTPNNILLSFTIPSQDIRNWLKSTKQADVVTALVAGIEETLAKNRSMRATECASDMFFGNEFRSAANCFLARNSIPETLPSEEKTPAVSNSITDSSEKTAPPLPDRRLKKSLFWKRQSSITSNSPRSIASELRKKFGELDLINESESEDDSDCE